MYVFKVLHGSIGRPAHEQRITKPLAVDAPRSRAADAYAGRYSRQGGSLAVSSCPEPANEFWFVGAGASVRHDTTLLVDNPRPGSAIVDITVYGPQGRVKAPGLRGITVAGHSSRTFDLTRVAPANGEVAAHVTTSRGLVSVSASELIVARVPWSLAWT